MHAAIQTNSSARFARVLGVIGAPPTWMGPDGQPWVYEPYVREMRIWADLFARVRVCSSWGEGERRGNLAAYERDNIEWIPVEYSDFVLGLAGKFKRLCQLPRMAFTALRVIRESDFVLLRSPSHHGLLGSLFVRCLGKPSLTKWAGENGPYRGERLPSRLNRWIESLPGKRHFTLVYGPPRRRHQISFIPALMNSEELLLARELARGKTWRAPWRILSVGRLEPEKQFEIALRALGILRRRFPDWPWHYTLIGQGSRGPALRALAQQELPDRVTFTGALPFSEVQRYYGAAHLVIMPSSNEGWGKVIAEAWAHGAIPVAAAVGVARSLAGNQEAGITFQPDPESLAEVLKRLLGHADHMASMAACLFKRAEELSLEHFAAGLERVLVERCGLK
jgi:glycosyltransferase involved in cell wall biosynthesis